MKLLLALFAFAIGLPLYADTLDDAIERSFVSNPEMIAANNSALNTLKFNPDLSTFKIQTVADDLTFEVVKAYLTVMLNKKRLELAQKNARLYRALFLNYQEKAAKNDASQSDLKLIASRLDDAELSQIRAEKVLQTAKRHYAKIVGSWPYRLDWPPVPADNELPASVGEAIEQGLANYFPPAATPASYQAFPFKETRPAAIGKRSILSFTKSVRLSWNEWTRAGLEFNQVKKQLVKSRENLQSSEERFHEGTLSLINFLNAEKQWFLVQNEYARRESEEITARYQIQNRIGKLLPYLKQASFDYKAHEMTINSAEAAALSEMELSAYPYPNYKPLLKEDLTTNADNSMAWVSFLKDPVEVGNGKKWYLLAGHFKNQANAQALTERLKGLGFMAIIPPDSKKSSVFVGPFDDRSLAVMSRKRLKEIAHLEGVLVKAAF